MGNNVMLYLDDIQHTNPEFLQKFISLCDAQRKIEGVWRGRTRTYDLRGKKFCVIMAGNPYTESGDVFKIPDMLANRADIYNLGDILSGREEVFALSYIENALTSNPVLAPLATREMEDVYKLVRMARGEDVPHSELKHNYSATEVSEIKTVLQKLTRVQSVVLRVNQQYIASASQADAFRNEPPFKLQGSYRNMNKMAEKVVSVMNDAELEALIRDHYVGEAQTLTTGAEENLLKLAELLGAMKPEEQRRWDEVKAAFQRSQRIGGGDADPVTRVVGQLDTLGSQLGGIQQALESSSGVGAHLTALQTTIREAAQIASQEAASRGAAEDNQAAMMASYLKKLHQVVERFSDAEVTMQINNLPTPGLDIVLGQFGQIIEGTLVPLLQTMELKLRSDEAIWQRLGEVSEVIKRLDPKSLGGKLRSHSQTVKPFKGDAPSKGDK
ncbi:MAG: DNA repair protein, partial [Myxococcales bacterium]|nr:DNA repair protein [Myxococcales bacterium]